ncbi:hypothetical protein BGZ72_002194, partial [Mortierella alpina]
RDRLEKGVERSIDKLLKVKSDDHTDQAVTQGAELKHSLQSLRATLRYVSSYAETKYRNATTESVQQTPS